MKLNKLFPIFALVAGFAMFACDPDGGGGQGEPEPGKKTDTTEVVTTDTVESIVMTVAEVIDIANGLDAGGESADYYKVTGVVTAVQTAADKLAEYGNCNFTLKDETGSIGCYYINYLNNQKFTSADQALNIGDTVVVVAKAKNYVNKNTGASTPELYNGYLAALSPNTYEAQIIDATFADIMTVKAGLAANETTIDKYRVTGVVSGVSTAKDKLVGYGNCNFNIADPTGAVSDEIICYYTNWLNGEAFTNADDIPVKGDTVVVVGPITVYNGKAEFYKGYIESIVRYQAPPIVPDDDSNLNVPEGTITCAQAIAIGKQLDDRASTDATYFIKGIVKQNDTYASTIKQYGNMTFYMVDDLNDSETFEAYQVYGLDSTLFVDVQQIVAGNVVVVKSKIYRYGDQIETVGKGAAYVYSSTNTFVPDTTGTSTGTEPQMPEGTQQVIDFSANALNLTETAELKSTVATYELGEVTLSIDPTGNNAGAKIYANEYRMYKSTTFTLSVPTGKKILYVAVYAQSGYGADLLTSDSGTLTVVGNNGFWTGETNSVQFGNTAQVRVNKLVVVYN